MSFPAERAISTRGGEERRTKRVNTNTGVLTTKMFEDVVERAKTLAHA